MEIETFRMPPPIASQCCCIGYCDDRLDAYLIWLGMAGMLLALLLTSKATSISLTISQRGLLRIRGRTG